MSSRLAFNTQLSSIMESVARFALLEVNKVVEQDSSELLKEVARLMAANSALEDKVSSLECELAALRKSKKSKIRYRSVAAQATGGAKESRDGNAISAPTMGAVFGGDVNPELWRESSPYSVERIPKKKIPDDIIVTKVIVGKDVELEAVATGEVHNETQEKGAAEMEHSSHVIPVEEEEEDVPPLQEESHEAVMNSVEGESSQDMITFEEAIKTIQDIVIPSDFTEWKDQLKLSRNHSCDICSKNFSRKAALAQHKKSHSSKYCSICLKLVRQNNKDKHNCAPPVSPGASAHVCDVCGKNYRTLSGLKMHKMIHTGERPYECTECKKTFAQKGNLKSHMHRHHGDKTFGCPLCNESFPKNSKLKKHLLIHM
ncbi:uncharacterized protein LOC142993358 [Genypterus blacodes]|uniref:uncharacterized protein LOC142993358 n=1 Tax=Genypterus blacodes TaxID=154954 RepID=UPI003F76B50D